MNNQATASKTLGTRITTLMKKNVPFLILLSLLILFSFMAPNFMTFGNLRIFNSPGVIFGNCSRRTYVRHDQRRN